VSEKIGEGDNVFSTEEDITGDLERIASIDDVKGYMQNGVPDGVIALIDDSGGTLVAPILEEFTGIICLAGTVRSHLGIISKENNIPCLMNADLDEVPERVTVQYSSDPRTTESYDDESKAVRADIWKAD
jgi:phosphohistidine swiveling domain-containing protein